MKESIPTSEELHALQQHMTDIATRLDYYGGLGVWAQRGMYLSWAAAEVSSWVDDMKEQEANN